MPTTRSISPKPTSALRLDFIDTARGATIVLVPIYHSVLETAGTPVHWRGMLWDPSAFPPAQALFQALMQCLQAPSLFFVLSGFLIHLSRLRNPQQPFLRFYLQRVARLYVAYLVALALSLAVLPLMPGSFNHSHSLWDLVTHLTLTHTFFKDTLYSINPSFWYVATELHLCLLYPLAMGIAARWGWKTLLVLLAAIECGCRLLGTLHNLSPTLLHGLPPLADTCLEGARYTRVFPAYWFTWMLGAWVAERWSQGMLQAPRTSRLWLWPTALVVSTLVLPLSGLAATVASLGIATWLARTLAHGVAAPRQDPVMATKLLRFLGSISLGLYLLNQPLGAVLMPVINEHLGGSSALLRILALAALMMAVTTPLALGMSRFIELPAQHLARRWLQPRPATRVEGSPGLSLP